ncbi:MAG: hypothetical protein AAF986_05545 [Pseudomonadota bacterium]
MQNGFAGIYIQMVETIYGHHCPNHLKSAVDAIDYRSAKKGKDG